MSFQDLEAGRPLEAPAPELARRGVSEFYAAVSRFRRLVDSLGTRRDTAPLRKRMHKARLQILQLAKDTSAKLKQVSKTDNQNEAIMSKKFVDSRLTRDFEAVLKEFQKVGCLAAERQAAYASLMPQNNHTSRDTVIGIDISSDKASEQQMLREFRRREALLLDNETVFNEAFITAREQGIEEIQHEIDNVHEIFKGLTVMVHDQGSKNMQHSSKAILFLWLLVVGSVISTADDIQSNFENSMAAATKGNDELAKAVRAQKPDSSQKCLLWLVFGIVVLIIIILVAYRS